MPKEKSNKNAEIIQLSEILKGIAHPSRIAIMNLLASSKTNKMTVKSLYKTLKISQPVMSRHLGILKSCGVIERSTEGKNTFYEINQANKVAKQLTTYFLSL